MAGPTQQSVSAMVIPPGESLRFYSPNRLAQKVQNLYRTEEDTLKTVIGPCQYLPAPMNNYAVTFSGSLSMVTVSGEPTDAVSIGNMPFEVSTPYSICQASLHNGSANMLYVKAGSIIYRYEGWVGTGTGDATSTLTGQVFSLSDTVNQRFPDNWVVFNDTVIWCNGIDRPRVFSPDGMVVPLGFDQAPGSPLGLGPASAELEDKSDHYPNSLGYSWEGEIGTAGDSLDGESGAVLSGLWYYHAQYEDIHGNLSPLSLRSSAVTTSAQNADPYAPGSDKETGTEFDNLLRQFFVRIAGDGPDHVVATRLYRTPDTKNIGVEPQLLQRFPGNRGCSYADNIPDSGLGSVADDLVPVPMFKLMTTHQGRLVVANVMGDPSIVRRSQPGFPGTFSNLDFIYPDSGGAEVTGIASHNGVLLSFTETSVYSLEDFGQPRPLAQGIGCIAPKSIKARPDGKLIWLGRDGFYGWRRGEQVQTLSSPLDRTIVEQINKSQAHKAVAYIDPETREYRCAVPSSGSVFNDLILCFDGEYWRRQKLHIHIADVAVTSDFRRYPLALVTDYTANPSKTSNKGLVLADARLDPTSPTILKGYGRGVPDAERRPTTNILVLDRSLLQDPFEPPDRKVIYRSGWMRGDESALTPVNVRSMYIALMDSFNGTATIRFYKNGSWKPQKEMTDLLMVGPDNESDVVLDTAALATIGSGVFISGEETSSSSQFHDPRLFWRQIPVGFENVSTWAFEIEVDFKQRFSLQRTYGALPLTVTATKALTSVTGAVSGPVTFGSKKALSVSVDTDQIGAKIHIAGFAFETSVATGGSPRGRIPSRTDR